MVICFGQCNFTANQLCPGGVLPEVMVRKGERATVQASLVHIACQGTISDPQKDLLLYFPSGHFQNVFKGKEGASQPWYSLLPGLNSCLTNIA